MWSKVDFRDLLLGSGRFLPEGGGGGDLVLECSEKTSTPLKALKHILTPPPPTDHKKNQHPLRMCENHEF